MCNRSTKNVFAAMLFFALIGWGVSAPAREVKSGDVKKEIVVEGRISKLMAQHMIGSVAGKFPGYFDVDKGGQIVIHAAGKIDCPDRARLKGTMFSITGAAGSKGEGWSEPQMDVASWKCIPAQKNQRK